MTARDFASCGSIAGCNQSSSLAFLGELCRAFPFRIRKLQCDNGHEFPFAFALAVEALGIRHRYIKPRRPQQNGKVERSHRIDHGHP